jgi:aspartate 1-decarboxylase
VCLNGAAARLVHTGDKVIIITYAEYEDSELEGHAPTVVHVDQWNRRDQPVPPSSARPAHAALQPAST